MRLSPQQTAELVRDLAEAGSTSSRTANMANPPHSLPGGSGRGGDGVINEVAGRDGKKVMYAFNASLTNLRTVCGTTRRC